MDKAFEEEVGSEILVCHGMGYVGRENALASVSDLRKLFAVMEGLEKGSVETRIYERKISSQWYSCIEIHGKRATETDPGF